MAKFESYLPTILNTQIATDDIILMSDKSNSYKTRAMTFLEIDKRYVVTNGDTTVTGDITATNFIGDGSGLTGIGSGTGGIINTGSTTIGADSDVSGVGVVALQTRGVTRLTVANLGNVGIGTASPDGTLHIHTGTIGISTPATAADDLIIENSDNCGITIFAPINRSSSIYFGDIDDVDIGYIAYTHNIDSLEFGTNANTRLFIDAVGRIGIGLSPTVNMIGLSIEAGVLTLKETTTPTADTNYGKIYTKSDNALYFQDGAGVEHTVTIS